MDLNISLTFCSHAVFFFIQTVVAAIMVHLSTELIVKSRKPVKRKLSSQEYLRTVTHLHLSNKNIEDIVSTHYVNSVLSFLLYFTSDLILFFRATSLFAGTSLSSTFMTTESHTSATWILPLGSLICSYRTTTSLA